MARIELHDISKSYGALEVLRNIDLVIEHGEFIVLVGPSGCGKSTLLRMIAGLEPITSGTISIDGERVNERPPRDRDIAMVFQSYALYPHMDVARNMGFSLEIRREPAGTQSERVREAAGTLGLRSLLERLPRALSGGQRQRVAMGRAIVRDPRAFLFDEPLSNLDAALRVEMRLEIPKLHQRLGATMVYVTHDQVEALTLANRIVVMHGGDIQQIGTPMELYEQPANLFVAQFIGSPTMNVMPAAAVGSGVRLGDGSILPLEPVGGAVSHLGIRPEHAEIVEPGGAHVGGTVEVVERLGSEANVYLDLQQIGQFLVRHRGFSPLKPGDLAGVRFDLGQTHLFDDAGIAVAVERSQVSEPV